MGEVGPERDRSGEGWTRERLGGLIGASRLLAKSFDALTPIDKALHRSRLSHVYNSNAVPNNL